MHPQPDRWKRLTGAYRADRSTGDPIELPPATLDPPEGFEGPALAQWERVTGLLARAGVLSELDHAVLVSHCRAWAEYEAAEARIAEEGAVITGQRGGLLPNPWVTIRDRAARRVMQTGAVLGLTPAARKHVRVAFPPKPSNRRLACDNIDYLERG